MKGNTLGALIKLIVFAVVTIFATALLVVVIQNRQFGSTRDFTALFVNATGLEPGDQVKMAGVRVGTVKSVDVVDSGGQGSQAKVVFAVNSNVPISDSTNVDIHYLNLVGQRFVDLVEKPGTGQPQNPDSVIPVSRTAPSLDLTALFDGFRPLFHALTPKDVNSFALEIIKTLQGEGGTIQELVSRSATLTNTIANHDALVGQVIDNLTQTLQTVQSHDTGLRELISQLQQLVTSLADNRQTIAASLGNINALTGQSSTLLKQIRPHLTPDIKYLGDLANNLNTTKNCRGYFDNPGLMNNKQLSAYLQQHGLFADNNCNGPNTLAEFLHREPTKLAQIIRSGSYGAFFNFYACDIGLENSSIDLTFDSSACGS